MHFFIDHTKLVSQTTNGQSFGPSAPNLNAIYDVSADFNLSGDAKALACQAGQIVVTEHVGTSGTASTTLVNLVLRPAAGLDTAFPAVRYYVYRGIRRDSFFSAGSINAKDPGNTDTVRKMWEDHEKNPPPSPPPPAPSDLGFDPQLQDTERLEELFAGELVTLNGTELRSRNVSEGEWIGTFDSSQVIRFEAIVDPEFLDMTVGYARRASARIDVGQLSSIASPSPAALRSLRSAREKVLAYVDPAALFGMHYAVGVTGLGVGKKKGDALATTFLANFSTANRVYIDVRSEKGYSYDFYGNYGDASSPRKRIKVRPGSAAEFTEHEYYTHEWPIFMDTAWSGPSTTIPVRVQLRVDDNIKPLLYSEDKNRLRPRKNFFDESRLLNGAATDWTKTIKLVVDGAGPSPRVPVATHVRLQYARQTAPPAPNPHLLQFSHHLDTVFGGIDLDFLGTSKILQKVWNSKVGLAAGSTFSHIPETGMYHDQNVTLLYSTAKDSHKTNADKYPSIDFSQSKLDDVVRSPVFPEQIVFNRWTITEGGTDIPVIDLSLYKKGEKNTAIDGAFFLGLKNDELDRLKALSGFSSTHQRFLVFEEDPDKLDDTGFPYRKYQIKVQGLDANGQRHLATPNPAVEAFGSGANMFCSTAFSTTVQLPNLPPDPGVMKQWDHINSGSYQFGDPDVTAVVGAGGRITVTDIGNDLSRTSVRVRMRAIYAFPVDAAGDATPSSRNAEYPLVVIVHGNGHSYIEYRRLVDHLAHNGFIAVSINLRIVFDRAKLTPALPFFVAPAPGLLVIFRPGPDTVTTRKPAGAPVLQPWVKGTDFDVDLDPITGVPDTIRFLKPRAQMEISGMGTEGRSNVLFKHLEVIKSKWGAKVADKIGLIGHSRGGEAVIRALDHIAASSAPANLRDINAVITLAPTDLWEKEELTDDIPCYVLYGSRDGDVNGATFSPRRDPVSPGPTGSGPFSLYDRAINRTQKSMSFVYGATHNGFITSNKDGPGIAPRRQKRTAVAYMNAFMRQHLLNETAWTPYFTGAFIPGSTGYHKIYQQYRDMKAGNFSAVDDFDTPPHDWDTSSEGETVAHSRAGTGLEEGFLNPHPPTIDSDSPHETFGLKVTDWNAADKLTFDVAGANQDVTGRTHVSFRITHVARRANASIDSMKIALVDTASNRHEASLTRTVPKPDPRVTSTLTKSAFMSIRIPLEEYGSNGVDLTKIQKVEFVFPAAGTGNIELDDVEFTK
jgi:dienelactone hydrolase